MYHTVLVPLDGSALAECSLQHAKAIARALQVDKVFVIRVVPLCSSWVVSRVPAKRLESWHNEAKLEAQKYILEIASALTKEGVNAEGVLVCGKPAEQIVDFAKRNGIDLIVMATHGLSEVSRRPCGSVTEEVLDISPVPILMVRHL